MDSVLGRLKMKKHILNVVILMLLLVGIAFCYFTIFPPTSILYDEPPTDKAERLAYMQELVYVIQDGIEQRQSRIDIRAFSCDANTLKEIMTLISFSNPLYSFYTDSYAVIFSIRGSVKYIRLEYNSDNKIAYITDEIATIVDTMNEDLSDLDKVIWINNYICTNYDYDTTSSYNDVFGLLSYKKGACGAYTQMFTLLANEAGLQSSFAISFTMQHVWNVVEVDGHWYNIDVTWNDDDTYTYCYLSSDEAMLSFHSYMRSTEDTIQFISCNDTRYDRVQLSEE